MDIYNVDIYIFKTYTKSIKNQHFVVLLEEPGIQQPPWLGLGIPVPLGP